MFRPAKQRPLLYSAGPRAVRTKCGLQANMAPVFCQIYFVFPVVKACSLSDIVFVIRVFSISLIIAIK